MECVFFFLLSHKVYIYVCVMFQGGNTASVLTAHLTRIQNLALHHNSLHLIFTTQVIVHPASPN